MKLKVTETIEKEVEVKIPSYYSNSCHTYKLISEEHCIQVTLLDGHHSIAVHHSGIIFNIGTPLEVSEDFFLNKYAEAVNKFSGLV